VNDEGDAQGGKTHQKKYDRIIFGAIAWKNMTNKNNWFMLHVSSLMDGRKIACHPR
jgi:hypothetical protein